MEHNFKEKRFGTILIPSEIYVDEKLDLLHRIFTKIIPLNIRYDVVAERYEITCYCEDFAVLEIGQVPDIYRIEYNQDSSPHIKFIERNRENLTLGGYNHPLFDSFIKVAMKKFFKGVVDSVEVYYEKRFFKVYTSIEKVDYEILSDCCLYLKDNGIEIKQLKIETLSGGLSAWLSFCFYFK
jgi:hypothetical protein